MPQGAGVVGHQQVELARAFHGVVSTSTWDMSRVLSRLARIFFHIQNEEHPVLDAQHAGDAFARVGLHISVGRLDDGSQVIRWMLVTEETKGGLHAAEFGDDDLVVLITGHFPCRSQAARFRMGSTLAAQIEGTEQQRRSCLLGTLVTLGMDDFANLLRH